MAAAARAHRSVQALTELPAGARPLELIRKRGRSAEDGEGVAGGKGKKGSGGAQSTSAQALRQVQISLGQVAQATGSAYIEVGRSKLLCTVHGPRPDARATHFSEEGRLVCEVKFAAYSGVANSDIERHTRELPLIIHPALEAAVQLNRFPKSLLEVHVLVLEQDGDICGPAITAASLALADAGIEMFDLVAACSLARFAGSGKELVLDPTGDEVARSAGAGSMTMAMMPARGEVTQLSHVGDWQPKLYEEAMDLGLEACRQLHTLMRQALISSVQPEP